ncbi:hypothetical protein L6452_38862 [Arctium lappa]|uniref:Uncharacterized protein n=1 Tax=Arctium lappa TaxID=4217 RepID=A0ACB8XQQ0_ARCLA|nr:hypothetical protein L6452_38862 [Arctium lappa]
MEAKKMNEKEKFDGTWNIVRRRRVQNRGIGVRGRQNGGIQGGGAVGKKRCGEGADKGNNVQGNELVVRMDDKPVVKPFNDKKNIKEGNANKAEIKNKFDVLNKIPLGVTKEAWKLQNKIVDLWLELKNEPPDHNRETLSKDLLDYLYARCDFKTKKGYDVLPNDDAP